MSKRKKKRKCKDWCRSVAHGKRGYCTKRCRDKAERDGTIEGRPGRVLMVNGIRVPDWFPLFDDDEGESEWSLVAQARGLA